MLMQLAAATAAKGTNLPTIGCAFCKMFLIFHSFRKYRMGLTLVRRFKVRAVATAPLVANT